MTASKNGLMQKDLEWDKAVSAFREGDKAGALFIFKKMAHQGRAEACAEIGNIYELGGHGVDQDYALAREWYEKAIQRTDDPLAYLALGYMYFTGRGVSENLGTAYYYFSQLEHDANPNALFALGYMNEFGFGVPMNKNAALNFYQSAIDNGHIYAYTRYGLLSIKLRRRRPPVTE